jgi:voltage-gated potassium channel
MQSYPDDGEETGNVLILTLIIGLSIIAISTIGIWRITDNAYLSAYYTLRVFFADPISNADIVIASLASTGSVYTEASIIGLEIIDNLSRMLIISFIVAAVIDLAVYSNIEEYLNRIAVRHMDGHVIICGYGGISENLAAELYRKKEKFIVIEPNAQNTPSLNSVRFPVIGRRFTENDVLKSASITKAKAIVFTSLSDMDNVIGIITARHLNQNIKIISRATTEETRRKMIRAGSDICILPEQLAGLEMGIRIIRAVF